MVLDDITKRREILSWVLVRPALSSIDEKSNVLIIGGGDGGTARECVKYSQISKIDLVEIDEEVIKISKKFLKKLEAKHGMIKD